MTQPRIPLSQAQAQQRAQLSAQWKETAEALDLIERSLGPGDSLMNDALMLVGDGSRAWRIRIDHQDHDVLLTRTPNGWGRLQLLGDDGTAPVPLGALRRHDSTAVLSWLITQIGDGRRARIRAQEHYCYSGQGEATVISAAQLEAQLGPRPGNLPVTQDYTVRGLCPYWSLRLSAWGEGGAGLGHCGLLDLTDLPGGSGPTTLWDLLRPGACPGHTHMTRPGTEVRPLEDGTPRSGDAEDAHPRSAP